MPSLAFCTPRMYKGMQTAQRVGVSDLLMLQGDNHAPVDTSPAFM